MNSVVMNLLTHKLICDKQYLEHWEVNDLNYIVHYKGFAS